MAEKARKILEAVGGTANVKRIDACAATRVRLELDCPEKMNDAALSSAGVRGIMRLQGTTVHLLVGLNADQYAAEMQGQAACYNSSLK